MIYILYEYPYVYVCTSANLSQYANKMGIFVKNAVRVNCSCTMEMSRIVNIEERSVKSVQ